MFFIIEKETLEIKEPIIHANSSSLGLKIQADSN